tara:strand:+ start:554 stop:1570 length:1017 start_codon:yes stop_codon:yes gene_type:complete
VFNTQQYALIRNSEGNFVYGEGPFTSSDKPTQSGVSFYLNNYDLTNQTPWLIPDSWKLLDRNELLDFQSNSIEKLNWKDPSVKSFEVQFNDIQKSIKGGVLKKTVPVVSSTAFTDDRESLMRSLIIKGARNEGPSFLYAFQNSSCGFVGLSPELLFELDEKTIRTMALAGTSSESNLENFILDEKEEIEHQIVVDSLRRRLGKYGAISESEKRTHNLGGIVHFLTDIKIKLKQKLSISEVLKQIHPTPAIGTVPRNKSNFSQLKSLRKSSSTPEMFAAPFGVKLNQSFFSFIMIRGLFFDNSSISLPTGCGITENSILENEWDELALKRHWVKNEFDL